MNTTCPHRNNQGNSEFEVFELAVRGLAIQSGLFSHEDHRRFSEWAETIGPSRDSKLVAKVWTALRCRHRRAGR